MVNSADVLKVNLKQNGRFWRGKNQKPTSQMRSEARKPPRWMKLRTAPETTKRENRLLQKQWGAC